MTHTRGFQEKPVVGIVKGKDIERNVRKLFELAGLSEETIKTGDRVLIKPNLVTPSSWPVTTNPRVLESIAGIAREMGASKVYLGDSSSFRGKPDYGTGSWKNEDVFTKTGLDEMAKARDIELVDFDRQEYFSVDIPQGVVFRRAKIPRLVTEMDAIINVPVLKTHFETLVTLGIKNLHGFLHDTDKPRYHRNDLSQKLVDILRVITPTFTVIDGIKGIEGFGPLASGDILEMDLLLGGKDVVAVDAVSSEVMGIDAMEVETTRIANAQGLGVGLLNDIQVKGEAIEDVRRVFKRPDVRISGMFEGIDVIQGGVCHHCFVRTRQFLELLKGDGILEKTGINKVIVGVSPRIPDPEELQEGKILIVGDCARYAGGILLQLMPDRCICLDGCPPVRSTYANFYRLRDATV